MHRHHWHTFFISPYRCRENKAPRNTLFPKSISQWLLLYEYGISPLPYFLIGMSFILFWWVPFKLTSWKMHRSMFFDTCITVMYICFLSQIFRLLKFGNGKYSFKLSCSCAAATKWSTTAVEFLFLDCLFGFWLRKPGKAGKEKDRFWFFKTLKTDLLLKEFVADFMRKW